MDIVYYLKMRNVERLQGTPKLKGYNLLEHSYMVAILFRHFASKEDIAYDMQVFDFILHHDIAETVTTDLQYNVKNHSEVTKECWETIENELLNKHHQLRRYSDARIKDNLTEAQYELFKVCDLLDLWLFLKEDQALGNSSNQALKIISNCKQFMGGKFQTVDKFVEDYENNRYNWRDRFREELYSETAI